MRSPSNTIPPIYPAGNGDLEFSGVQITWPSFIYQPWFRWDFGCPHHCLGHGRDGQSYYKYENLSMRIIQASKSTDQESESPRHQDSSSEIENKLINSVLISVGEHQQAFTLRYGRPDFAEKHKGSPLGKLSEVAVPTVPTMCISRGPLLVQRSDFEKIDHVHA